MKKFFALILALTMVLGLVACGGDGGSKDADVYNVCNIVNGNLGDKSFFDSAKAGLDKLVADGRIKLTTLELGGAESDQPKWLSTLHEVAESEEYDLIICGTYQMPDYLKEVATKYPEQKFLIYDDTTYVGQNKNVVNMSFKQNDLGYLVGVFAAGITTETSINNINADAVLGFVGGVFPRNNCYGGKFCAALRHHFEQCGALGTHCHAVGHVFDVAACVYIAVSAKHCRTNLEF